MIQAIDRFNKTKMNKNSTKQATADRYTLCT